MKPAALNGLDLLATAVVVVDQNQAVLYMNPAAENLFEASHTSASGLTLERLLGENAVLDAAIAYSRVNQSSYTEHEIETAGGSRQRLNLACTVSPADFGDGEAMLLEFRQIDQQLRVEREARLLEQSQAHRELIRNLAHEIKNPLGGIRGAAQLLDRELERPGLHEYTQVIIKESDRLQALMDRLLTPHRLPLPGPVNIHEVLERVRSVMLAEFPDIAVRRDYDISLPLLTFIADISALFGGLLVGWGYGGISPEIFLARLQNAIGINTFLVGLIKAPFMALVIGVIACLEGFRVQGSAESLGRQVTASVVDLSQSLRFGRCCECVPTLRRSTVKPIWLIRHNRWLIHSELAAMMGFPVAQLFAQVAGVPVDTATMAGPPAALGNAMHIACVGTALACALTATRCRG